MLHDLTGMYHQRRLGLTRIIFGLMALTSIFLSDSFQEVRAEEITYTWSGGTIDGTLAGVSFDNVDFSFTVRSNTSDITAISEGFTTQDSQPASVTLSGIGTFTLTGGASVQSILLVGSSTPEVGLTVYSPVDSYNVSWFELGSSALAGYDLASSIGPIISGAGNSFDNIGPIPTNAGGLDIDIWDITSDSGFIFDASVPEPSTLLMGLFGLCLVGAEIFQRFTNSSVWTAVWGLDLGYELLRRKRRA